MSVPFVGRQRELDELGGLIRQSSQVRAPVSAVVTGEPGTGKTRLLAEIMARQAHVRRVRVIGFEPNQTVPLAAVGEVIRTLATVPVHGPRLEALVFGGRDRASRAPIRIFEAAHRAMSACGPLLIGIDDLQWVDEQSLGFIQYLLRAADPARQPLMVIIVSRPSSAAAVFAATVEGLFPPDRRAVLKLGPLQISEGLSLARSIDRTLDDATARAIWHRARGSPFWLEALVRSGAHLEPAELIADRLRALGADAGALLAILAVGARPFLLEEAAELLGWEGDRLGQASRELLSHGLGAEVSGTIRLAHDLIREAAAASLPLSARRRLHARLADWIERNAGDDVKLLREALDHRIAAGQSGAALASRLLSSPGRRLLNADGLRLIASISDELEERDELRTAMDRALAELAAAIGEVDLAIERWTRVAQHATELSERRDAATEAALTAYRFGRRDEAHKHIEATRVFPGDVDATVRLDALQADVELWLDHETTAGSRSAARALAGAERLAETSGGLERMSDATRRAYLAALEASIDAAMQESRDDVIPGLSQQCVRVARSLDDESHIAAQIRAGQALRTVGQPRDGEVMDRLAWDSSKRLILPTLTIGAGRELARVLRDLGRLVEAHAVAVETRELEARLTAAPIHWGSSHSMRHIIELSIAEPAAALRELRRDAAAEPDPHYRQDIHLAIAAWQARVAGVKAAREVEAELAAAHADAELARCPRHTSGLALATAELLARVGRAQEARRALEDWDRRKGPKGVSRHLARPRAAAWIEASAGNTAAAVTVLEAYAHALEHVGLGFELLWAQMDLGRWLSTVDRDRAVATFTAAAALADRSGAASEGRLVAQALRGLGVRAWRRGRSGDAGDPLAGLSSREREVARLVARGSSNREIADLLALAPKTVERHVTNILAKTGMRNRTELAARVQASASREESAS